MRGLTASASSLCGLSSADGGRGVAWGGRLSHAIQTFVRDSKPCKVRRKRFLALGQRGFFLFVRTALSSLLPPLSCPPPASPSASPFCVVLCRCLRPPWLRAIPPLIAALRGFARGGAGLGLLSGPRFSYLGAVGESRGKSLHCADTPLRAGGPVRFCAEDCGPLLLRLASGERLCCALGKAVAGSAREDAGCRGAEAPLRAVACGVSCGALGSCRNADAFSSRLCAPPCAVRPSSLLFSSPRSSWAKRQRRSTPRSSWRRTAGGCSMRSTPDTRNYPASLTKMMTLYMVFEAVQRGGSRCRSSSMSPPVPPGCSPPSSVCAKAVGSQWRTRCLGLSPSRPTMPLSPAS